MTCTNARCLYWITCQKKERPCPANAAIEKATSGNRSVLLVHSGYAEMARQEQAMRMASINFKGDFDS